MKKCEGEESKKKPVVLNKAFMMDQNVERINRVNEKINTMIKHTGINNS
jgi:hypothetical protein